MNRFLLASLGLGLLVGCGQPSMAGIWKGTFDVDDPGSKTSRRANNIGNPILDMRADHTFSLAAGLTIRGKWRESEGKIVYTVESVNERSLKEIQSATRSMPEEVEIEANISPDRQKITIDRLPGVNMRAKVEFMR